MRVPVHIRREVETAIAAALELPESEQMAFIAREYGHNPTLCAEVETILRAHREASRLLELSEARPARMVRFASSNMSAGRHGERILRRARRRPIPTAGGDQNDQHRPGYAHGCPATVPAGTADFLPASRVGSASTSRNL